MDPENENLTTPAAPSKINSITTQQKRRPVLRDLNAQPTEPHPRTILGLKRRSSTGSNKPAVRSKLQFESTSWLDRLDSLADDEIPPIEYSTIEVKDDDDDDEVVAAQVAKIVAKLGGKRIEVFEPADELAPILDKVDLEEEEDDDDVIDEEPLFVQLLDDVPIVISLK